MSSSYNQARIATFRNLKIKTSTCKRLKRLKATLADLKGDLAEWEEVNQEGPEIEDARSTMTEVENLYQAIED
ncbi:hypothetical protein Ddye_028501 [Dipteronia dyeriana]|uniref:Tubulin-specific chaperone A n=1 Tax=Dipteronia dyeriana TaxID=168575 RepID=A0AAD9TRA3_9ROSI|nr:hypothetical protein Ddye_028501 [Dipteronia dyeriana]